MMHIGQMLKTYLMNFVSISRSPNHLSEAHGHVKASNHPLSTINNNNYVGIHTARIWSAFSVFASFLHIPQTVVQSVQQMRKAFHVLYLFDFESDVAKMKLQWYKDNIEQVKTTFILVSN